MRAGQASAGGGCHIEHPGALAATRSKAGSRQSAAPYARWSVQAPSARRQHVALTSTRRRLRRDHAAPGGQLGPSCRWGRNTSPPLAALQPAQVMQCCAITAPGAAQSSDPTPAPLQNNLSKPQGALDNQAANANFCNLPAGGGLLLFGRHSSRVQLQPLSCTPSSAALREGSCCKRGAVEGSLLRTAALHNRRGAPPADTLYLASRPSESSHGTFINSCEIMLTLPHAWSLRPRLLRQPARPRTHCRKKLRVAVSTAVPGPAPDLAPSTCNNAMAPLQLQQLVTLACNGKLVECHVASGPWLAQSPRGAWA